MKDGKPVFTEALRQHIADEFMAKRMELAKPGFKASPGPLMKKPVQVASSSPLFDLASLLTMSTFTAPSGNGLLMAASFAPFKPKVRYYWDSTYFYEESDGIPDRVRQPNLMVGITSWQQQVPLPASYFASTTNGTNNTGSLGYQQPNYWKIPLVPVPAASPISLTGNFLRGAVALGADGVAIFNPRNNTGQFSQAIGELDTYGGHCGLGDDYHYHIFPVHLIPILGNATPIAWGLDGYPVYGYLEPDGSAQQALDVDGGHDHGTWGYHYHARGTFNAGTGTWTPASPYMMSAMHGTVVNFDSQIDPQPTASGLRASGTGGYTAVPVAGAAITAFKNPVALTLSGGHLVENVGGVASDDSWLMRYTVSGTSYDICWQLNRSVNPRTMTITWRHPTSGTTTTTYNNSGNRITQYPMAGPSIARLPDTGQILNATATIGEDSDYTRNAPSFVDNGNGTISDFNTGLMWQKVGNGESTWEAAVANAASITTGGYTDWRLPTPSELFSIQNHENNNPALNTTYFPSSVPAAEYWWTSDIFGSSTTNIWCANAGGGLGPKPKSETVSAGGAFQYHARYVRGAKPTNGHNYVNNGDGTITDLDTNLMWSQVPSSNLSWTAALTYAEGLTLGGYSDWRMPNVNELESLVDFARATATTATTTPCLNRTLFPSASATSYWSSSSQKAGTPTSAWMVEFGVNTTSNPPRNAQGIISYEPYASTYPTFAVRTVPSASTTQGRATTVTTNLFPAGQRVAGVGTITATDGSAWTVPASTQFTTAAKAPDLYNEYNAVTPANITAAQTAINALPTQVIDADGEVVTGYIFSDNYFELYVNGALVGVDPVPYTSFNSCVVKFKAKRPITYAVKLVDWEENLGLGTELNGGDPYHIGDGGFMASFSDGTVTNNQWKAQTFNISPLDSPSQVVDLVNGTHDSSSATTHTLTETAYALHYPVPSNWSSKSFGDGGWPAATTYTEAQVGINNIPAYSNFPAQFSASGAQFIWSSNLLLDNEVVVRYTGPAGTPSQIAVEQPAGTALIDGSSTVAYGSVNVGSTLSKTFTIKNNSSTSALSITGVTLDGTNAANFTVTTSPASSIAASGSTTMVVQFNASTIGAKTAALHIASSDASVGAAFDVNLSGSGVVAAPAITNIVTTPTVPSNTDTPIVSATITPASGAIITSATLTYGTGAQTTTTVFNEPFATTATGGTGGWDGTGATYPWTPTSLDGGGNIKQTAGTSNHTAIITGSCGVVLGKGASTTTDPTRTMVTLTNPINATGTFTSGSTTTNYVEFWVRSVGLTGTNGWSFQLAPNGTTFTERRSEFTGSIHEYQLYHYDLLATDLTSTLKMRFGFVGNGVGGPTGSTVNIDDIVVVTTSGSAPTPVTMSGPANGGSFSAVVPAQVSGTTITYSIAATDSNGQTTTITNAGSYTTGPAPSITTGATLPSSSGGAYSQTLVASGGSGTGYTWSVNAGSTLPAGLTLSSAGVLSGTPTANGTFNFTLKVADSAGRIATRAFTLTISGANATPPNVVIIVTDDQGWGDVGYHTPSGQVPIQTPNMDSFGTTLSGSIRLERFYATTVCSVTRSTLMTGRNAIRHGTNNERGLDLSEHLMPQTFKAAGYQTFMCGKWHLGGSDKNIYHFNVNGSPVRVIKEGLQYAPFNRGWDSHYGQYSGAIDYFTHNSAEAESLDVPDWWLNGVQQDGPSEHTDSRGYGGWSPTLLADKAIAHIQNRNPAQPMLLHLAFNSIHGPVSAPASLITKYQNLGVTNANRRLISAAVDGMDQEIGRVLAALDTAGIANNTLVIWFGDNGGDETKGSLNDPLRGTKGDSYEGGMREPAGIRWPGVLPTGVISNQYMWVGDVFPTICAAVGVTPQNTKPLDGVNLWPALLSASNSTTVSRGTPLVTVTAAPIAIYQFTDPVNGGVKDFKIIRSKVGTTTVTELYNLTDDPQETTDLIGNSAYASIVTTLTNAITAISVENFKPYVGPPLITNTVPQGSTITLYAPFTSWPGATPTVQWRKGGSNVAGGVVTQITDDFAATVRGTYAATLTLTNVSPSDAGSYDVVVTNNFGSTTSDTGTLTVTFGAPVLNAMAAYTKGTSATVTWPAVSGATSYTIQRAATSNFASVLSSQTVSTPTATFTGLTSGTQYFYRATATDGSSTSPFSNTVSSTQDASTPVVIITSPANNTITAFNTVNVQGTAAETISPVTGVVVNGVTATTSDAYAHWSATVPLTPGANTITANATDSSDAGGNSGTASITVTLNATGPTITSVSTGPTAPTYLDPTYVLAAVTPASGTTISQVRLLFDTGTPVSTAIWKEVFNITNSNNWNGTGALNAWTTVGGGVVRQAIGASNHTVPISITNATTNGTTLVTCDSTANLWPNMRVTGLNIPSGDNIALINSPTSFTLVNAATGSGSALSLTAMGMVLTNCTTTGPTPGPASATVTCDNTIGLVNGMGLTGTGVPNNATLSSFTTTAPIGFTMNAVATATGTGVTVTASGAAAEFNGGTANLTDSMFTTTNAINTTGTAGYVEFWVQTRDLAANNNCGWQFQISSDNGTTWHNAVDDSVNVGEDWNSETVNLTNVVLNSAGNVAGSTTVTCASTVGLAAGRAVSGPITYVTGSAGPTSAIITGTDTTNLKAGMFLTGNTGIPNTARILTIDSATQFTMTVNSTVTATTTVSFAASYFPANASVASVSTANTTTFTLNAVAYVNTTAAPITAAATTINHGYQLFHHDLDVTELVSQMKMRFQATGYTPTAPTRSPRISIDDIVVATTAPPPTVTLALFDDGNHGDGAANDGVWGAAIPAQTGGTTVNFRVVATDNNAATSTSPSSSNYTYTVNNLLTDATILGAEFLTLPKTDGVTLNLIASVNQEVFVEYGTQPGKYTLATTPTTFNIDNAKPEFKNPIRIPITGLQQDTEYYYRVRHRNVGAGFFNARGERSFHTARPRGTTFSFTVTADPHIDVNTDMQLFWRAMQNISIDNPDIHMDVGDIFMTDKLADGLLGVPPKWGGGVTIDQTTINNRAIIFRNAFERACHSIPFFFGLGNHEAEYGYLFNAASDKQNNIPAWDLKARKAFYPAPTPDGFFNGNPTPKDYTGGSLGLLEDYYAFEWGEALFIMLDPFWNTMTNPNSSNDAWNWSLGQVQYNWLRDTLKNSSAKYKFVFMHHIVGGSTQAIINGVPTPQFAARGGIEVSDKYEWGGKNADGSPGFATKRPGWDMPIHDLLVLNKVNVVFHGHDHLYGYQTKDGIVYLECPQPGTPNYSSLGSAVDGQYVDLGANSTSYLLPNSGHIRITVGPDQAVADYVRSYRAATDPMPPDATSVFNDETASRHNRDISHSFVLAPKMYAPIEVANVGPGQVGLRWNAVRNKPYQVQWSTDLINWTTIDTLTFTNTNTNATYTDSLPARVNGLRAFYRVSYTP